MGDSISAELECDYRQAIVDYDIRALNETNKGASYPSISSSSRFFTVGCDWYCKNGTYSEALHIKHVEAQVPNSTTHIIFNLGAHYSYKKLKNSLPIYMKFLKGMHEKGIRILVRTQGVTHFPSSTGDYYKPKNYSSPFKCARATFPQNSIIHKQNELLRGMVQNLSFTVVDITGLSDDPLSHPDFVRDKKRDCRHLCQNCDMIRSWNSLMLQHL